jgi:hypothetical protein
MEVGGQFHAPAALPPRNEDPLFTEKNWWDPGPVGMIWRREMSIAPTEIGTPDPPAHQPVCLHYPGYQTVFQQSL